MVCYIESPYNELCFVTWALNYCNKHYTAHLSSHRNTKVYILMYKNMKHYISTGIIHKQPPTPKPRIKRRDSPCHAAKPIFHDPLCIHYPFFNPIFYTSTAPVLLITKPLLSALICTTAVSPVFSSPLIILSASPLPISLEMSLLSGRAPNFGS